MAAVLPASTEEVTDSRQDNVRFKGTVASSEWRLGLMPGELVRVKSASEIVATLDGEGKVEGIPFMIEMLPFCGRQFRVLKRADSTCARGMPRRIEDAVYLDQLRCSGWAHRRCQAACLLLWKEAWLGRDADDTHTSSDAFPADSAPGGAPTDIAAVRVLRARSTKPGAHLSCQATEMWSATRPIDLGNPVRWITKTVRDTCAGKLGRAERQVLVRYLWGKLILLTFTRWTKLPWNRNAYKKTPSERLDLRPGEWVEVRGILDILRTLDSRACNRGLEFKAEMFQFCGRRFQVRNRLDRRIDERTGKLNEFRNECILLDGIYCNGQRSFCARCNYHYWREIWLRRVPSEERAPHRTVMLTEDQAVRRRR